MNRYNCEICTASCTIEAMMMCPVEVDECPVLRLLESGVIVDRRPTDIDPNFPSEFTYAESK